MSGPKKRPNQSRGAGSGPARPAGRAAGRPSAPKSAGPKSGGPKSGGPKPGGARTGGPKSGGSKSGGPKSGGARGGAAAKGGRGGPGSRHAGGAPVRSAQRGLDGTQVEGRHAVRELLLAGTRRTKEVLMAEQMDAADILNDIVELCHDLKVPLREISKRKLDTEAKTEASQGVVAIAEPLQDRSVHDLATTKVNGAAPFLIAVDGVTDPGNLGAIVRTAECAGVSGLLLPRHRAVHVTPTVTKAAAGAVEHVPMALVGGLPAAIEEMRKLGVWIVGLDAGGEKSLHDVGFGNEPVCLVLGAEGKGLSRLVRERCDEVVSIPLLGVLSSLNVATAASLGIYEVVRRRAEAGRQ